MNVKQMLIIYGFALDVQDKVLGTVAKLIDTTSIDKETLIPTIADYTRDLRKLEGQNYVEMRSRALSFDMDDPADAKLVESITNLLSGGDEAWYLFALPSNDQMRTSIIANGAVYTTETVQVPRTPLDIPPKLSDILSDATKNGMVS